MSAALHGNVPTVSRCERQPQRAQDQSVGAFVIHMCVSAKMRVQVHGSMGVVGEHGPGVPPGEVR